MIIDSNVALVAHRLLWLVGLRIRLGHYVGLGISDLEGVLDVLHRRVVDSSDLLRRLLLSMNSMVAQVVDKFRGRAHLRSFKHRRSFHGGVGLLGVLEIRGSFLWRLVLCRSHLTLLVQDERALHRLSFDFVANLGFLNWWPVREFGVVITEQ